jgi:hypothetical protein
LGYFQLPTAEKRPSSLSVLEVDDPKLSVLLHLMTPMTSIEPELESPLARPLVQQKSVAAEILGEVGSAKSATEGMLLSNMEHNGPYPFHSTVCPQTPPPNALNVAIHCRYTNYCLFCIF